MKTIRLGISCLGLLLLAGGYAASQMAYWQGRAADFARQIDTPPVVALSAIVLIASLLLSLKADADEANP